MISLIATFFIGFIFAIGLGLSGMTNPEKVIGFLDIFGQWDPSLLFVMAGAICIHMPLYWIIRRRKTPLLSLKWYMPVNSKVNTRLILGSVIFGVGWSLSGYCPGPAIASLVTFTTIHLLFAASMLTGMAASFIFISRTFR